MYQFDPALWTTHPVLKRGWSLVTRSLKNKAKYGWGRFDNDKKVLKFLKEDNRRSNRLAKLLVGPYCKKITECNKPYMEDGNPYKDFVEAMKTQYDQYHEELAQADAALSLQESNSLILENHRKSREVHSVARTNWWYNA